MSKVDSLISSLIQNSRRKDPTLADLLSLMQGELSRIAFIVDPPPIPTISVQGGEVERPRDITVFTYAFTKTNIILLWNAPQDGFLMYEIRTGSSSFSDGFTVLQTSSLQAIIDPNDEVNGNKLGGIGETVYTIMAFDSLGQSSVNEAVLSVVIPALGDIAITPTVINNQVVLQWTEPTSTFNIDYYKVYKNGSLIQDHLKGTFFVIQEIAGGSFTYGVQAVDIAGNLSPLATVTLDVNDPSDFEVQSSFLSTFSGTKTNTYLENNYLLACVNVNETFENHFLSRFWNTPQNQIDAGFPIFIQPAAATGSYKETFDFGTTFSNNIISYSWNFEVVAQSVTISISTRTSTDNVNWSSPIVGNQIFVSSPLRYVEVTVSFTSS